MTFLIALFSFIAGTFFGVLLMCFLRGAAGPDDDRAPPSEDSHR